MSRIRADKFVNNAANGAPQLTYGVEVIAGVGLTGAGGINITGVATATSFSGNVTGNISGGTVAGSTGTFTGDVDIADKIIHTGDTNTAIRFPAADTFTVETGGSERLRVNSSGNIGINSTIPRSKLHVANGNSNFNPGNPTGLGAGAVASLESSGDVALQFLSSTSTDNFIYFGDTDSATTGSIQYDHNVNALMFNTNGGTERLRIDSNGFIGIGENSPSSYDGGARHLVVAESSDNAGITIRSANNKSGSLYFADGTTGNEAYRGRIEYNHTDDRFQFGTAGTGSKVIITSTGEVRIGDNSTTASTAGDDLVIEGSSDRGISIISGTSSSGNVYFGDSGDTDIGRIAYQHNDNAFQFYTSATKRVQVDSDGIKFSSDTAAANGLNDYEEGNGTPSVSFETSGTATLGAGASFKYVKIGDLVTFSFEFQLSAVSSPSGGVRLALPFASGAGVYSAGAVRLYNVTFTGSPFLQIGPSSSSVVVLGSVSGAPNSKINGTGYYFGTISYRTSS